MPPRRKSIEERFWPKVDKRGPDECWPFASICSTTGYGVLYHGGKKHATRTTAHRIAYELLVGSIPEGLVIDHLCRNRACVNPAHLEAVTNAENLRRGEGWSGRNARKTHCNSGHPLSGENLYRGSRGRYCRACHAARERERRARIRAARENV